MNAFLIIPDGFDNLGFQVGYVATFWIGCIGLILMVASIILVASVRYLSGWNPVGVIGGIVAGLAACALLYPILAFFIQGPEFMKDYEVHGKVLSATNKFDGGTGDLTSIGSPVVRLEGVQTPLFINDDRILGMVGEDVILRCNPVWRYHADAYYRCEIKTFDQ